MNLTLSELESKLEALERRVADLEVARSRNPEAPKIGTIPRGKYIGRLHADIVKKDPEHVIWLFVNGFAEGMGYQQSHLLDAKAVLAANPPNRSLR